jgi:hypothetical protein
MDRLDQHGFPKKTPEVAALGNTEWVVRRAQAKASQKASGACAQQWSSWQW